MEASFSGPYGMPNIMLNGLNNGNVKSQLAPAHKLELSEKNFQTQRDQLHFSMARNIQGMHMPYRLCMERKLVLKSQRLSCLPSSNASYEALIGRDETIDFDDILNDPADSEKIVIPQVQIERRLGMLE